jgi:hypothetical protein
MFGTNQLHIKNVLVAKFHLFVQILQDGSTVIHLWKQSEMYMLITLYSKLI